MFYYRARKRNNRAAYQSFDHLHTSGTTCYVGFEKELSTEEVEKRDFEELGEMSHETFINTYGTIQENISYYRGSA